MKKKVKAASKGQKGERLGAVEGEQKGESGSETAAQQHKGGKKIKGQRLKDRNVTQRGGENKKTSEKTGSNSSGAKLKK